MLIKLRGPHPEQHSERNICRFRGGLSLSLPVWTQRRAG